jgi:hypothetical protein
METIKTITKISIKLKVIIQMIQNIQMIIILYNLILI